MTLALDDNVGLVLDTLQALNLATNTLVAFVNDNGGVSGRDNTPLRDFKGSLYEGGVRVPYLLRWAGLIPTNQVSHEPVITLDLLPTLLAAAGAPPPTNHPLDGVSLLPLALGQTNRLPREPLFFWRTGGRTSGQSAVRKGDWKLHRVDTTGQTELYQLNPDGTGEYTNLATNNPQKVLELMALFDQWEAQTPEPFWGNGAVTTLHGAWADSSDLGWLLDAATNRPAYVLTTLREPITWNEDFSLVWRMETTGARANENGYIAFGPGAAESSLIRAGLERSPGRLVITEPGAAGESELTGLTFPAGVLELELAYAVADNSLTLRWGTNTLTRILSTRYASVTHLGYAVWQAQTRFGFFEVRPATRLILHDPTKPSVPGAAFQFSVQVERQVPGTLTLERAAGLGGCVRPFDECPRSFTWGTSYFSSRIPAALPTPGSTACGVRREQGGRQGYWQVAQASPPASRRGRLAPPFIGCLTARRRQNPQAGTPAPHRISDAVICRLPEYSQSLLSGPGFTVADAPWCEP